MLTSSRWDEALNDQERIEAYLKGRIRDNWL
jgi:hypothetical protein